MYVAKYHTDGVMEWVKIVEGGKQFRTKASAPIEMVIFSLPVAMKLYSVRKKTALYDDNIFLIKFLWTASGTIDWATNIGGDIFRRWPGVAADDDGNIIVAGSFNEKMVWHSNSTRAAAKMSFWQNTVRQAHSTGLPIPAAPAEIK